VQRALAELWRDPIARGALALLAVAALSAAFSLSPRVSLLGERQSFAGLTRLAGLAVLFVATRAAASSPEARCALFWAALAGAVGAASYALMQRLGLDPISGAAPDWDPERVWGTLGNPTFLGDHLVSVLPLGLYLALRAWRRGQRGAACIAGAASALVGLAALLTHSRASFIAAALSLPALALGWRRSGERAGARVLALAGAAALGVALLFVAQPGAGGFDSSWARVVRLPAFQQEGRVEIWRAAAQMFAERPLTGVGVDAFHLAFPRHRTVRYWEIEWAQTPVHAHDEPLHVAATQGIAGLAALAFFVWAVASTWRRALRQARSTDDRARVVALGCALLALAVRSAFGPHVVSLGVLAASFAGLVSAEATPGSGTVSAPRRIGLVFAAAGAVAWWSFVETSLVTSGPRAFLGALFSAVWLLGPILAVAFAAARVEAAPRAPAAPERARPARPIEILVWPVAALALYYGVWRPFAADALCRTATLRIVEERPEAATVHLEGALRLAPDNPYYWMQLGLVHQWRAERASAPARRIELTRAAYRAHARASALVPASALYRAHVAGTLADLALVEGSGVTAAEALAAHTEVLALDPNNPLLWNDAARAALRLGDLEKGEAWARHSLSLHPGEAEPRVLLARAARQRGDLALAESELDAAIRAHWRGDVKAKAAAWEELASVREQAERPDEAGRGS
jgi:O-antigen ligase/tetratricopeptide (TPR) repeat protein